ncbi:hypothetical protein N7532_001185 [Penicillium argentinense]|uniref:Cupin type-1 domain-containing protein n=1 Tax=Penicillium argentinense TaxID=1131581 RepID=A0A9W9G214_9EURO|nr:uncharacterized protein N7532_001185 [Penicillium argentinense]KAJ5110650.1 hypothetical protein N7532_001185 [Penicillium argentinense]
MQEPMTYEIKPTKLIPNSPKPLLLYKNFCMQDGKVDLGLAYDTFIKNGWDVQWVTRYGRHQRSHYHPETHETMVVTTGPGIIRWGVADLDDDTEKNIYGDAFEEGGLQMTAEVGDVFVIPAGVAHKSFDQDAEDEKSGCLTGVARGIESDDPRGLVVSLQLEGFTMMGAYPKGFSWNWGEGGDSPNFEDVWKVSNAELDPVVGSDGGIKKYWV